MAVYAIILDAPNSEKREVLKKTWGNHYIHDDRIAFVAPDNDATTKDISEIMGMRGTGEKVAGLILQVSYYNGWNDVALWEWMEKNV